MALTIPNTGSYTDGRGWLFLDRVSTMSLRDSLNSEMMVSARMHLARFFACGIAVLSLACGPVSDGSSSNTPPPPDVPIPSPETEEWIEAPAGLCEDPFNLVPLLDVLDGDTIVIGSGTKVRYIGVDAPEVTHSDCWSAEAVAALKLLAQKGTMLCLMADENSADKDPYGRLLRYVFFHHDGRWLMQNTHLVRIGAARAYKSYLKNKTYKTEILDSELQARLENLGGWAQCEEWN